MAFALAEKNEAVPAMVPGHNAMALYYEDKGGPVAEYRYQTGCAFTERLGYHSEELDALPQAVRGSCGGDQHQFDLAKLRTGEHVAVFGSAARADSFVAAGQVGSNGRVVCIDKSNEPVNMTNSQREVHQFPNVDFRNSRVEDTGLRAETFDVVISNGVANVAADMEDVFLEAARLLKPGGRLVVTDLVTDIRLPEGVSFNATFWTACIGGALQTDQYVSAIEAAGFRVVEIEPNPQARVVSNLGQSADRKYGVKRVCVAAVKV